MGALKEKNIENINEYGGIKAWLLYSILLFNHNSDLKGFYYGEKKEKNIENINEYGGIKAWLYHRRSWHGPPPFF